MSEGGANETGTKTKPWYVRAWQRIKIVGRRMYRWLGRNYGMILITVLGAAAIKVFISSVEVLQELSKKEDITVREIETAFQGTLLSNGLTIIAIAIAVWAGLSITNAITKKDMIVLKSESEKVKNTGANVSKLLLDAKEDMKKITRQQGNLVNSLESAFKSELIKTKSDMATMWLFQHFSDNPLTDTSKNAATLQELIVVEQLFASVYAYHTSNQEKYRSEVLVLTEKAIENIENLLNSKSGMISKQGIISVYLHYRRAEFRFYRGYALEGDDLVRCFNDAIQDYLSFQKAEFGDEIIIDEYDQAKHDKAIAEADKDKKASVELSLEKEKEKYLGVIELKLYLLNTINECYNKMLRAPGVKSKEEQDIVNAAMSASGNYAKLIEKAIDVLERMDPKRISEVYYRNLGSYYEIANQKGAPSVGFESIIKLYEKALQKAIDDDNKVLSYRVNNIYYVLAQFLYKRINERIIYKDLNRVELLGESDEEKQKNLSKGISLMEKLRKVLYAANRELPRRRVYYSLEALLYSLAAAIKHSQLSIPKDCASALIISFSDDYYFDVVNRNYEFIIYTLGDDEELYPPKDGYGMEISRRFKEMKDYRADKAKIQKDETVLSDAGE